LSNPGDPASPERDGELLRRALDGDESAWVRLVDRHSSLVFRSARAVGVTPEDAEDVAQAVWIALVRNGHTIRRGESLPAWLAVTARRTALKGRRGNRPTFVALPEEIADETGTVDELIREEETLESLRAAVRSLPERCRDLFDALFREERPNYRDVARELGLPVGSIGPTRARCLARLERILRRIGGGS
jgi:RNA polymerase sigma factor (sigma-70 family)